MCGALPFSISNSRDVRAGISVLEAVRTPRLHVKIRSIPGVDRESCGALPGPVPNSSAPTDFLGCRAWVCFALPLKSTRAQGTVVFAKLFCGVKALVLHPERTERLKDDHIILHGNSRTASVGIRKGNGPPRAIVIARTLKPLDALCTCARLDDVFLATQYRSPACSRRQTESSRILAPINLASAEKYAECSIRA
ncbi:hypothetical protein K402DRAFT_20924 [Aulographum hederae CBS 113979]|uniref:Uncharacterized protein n=1 Tax=Aulographum hederae CBS 113979 TaxID=1176131 RepID=A0A6G1H6J3_9PEZI|nr:hypothetical protein K402DRAFT_20924 [Aulographum hederae CBS 113979]